MESGKTHYGATGSDGVWRGDQAFVVVRKVSRQDWIDYAHKIGVSLTDRDLARKYQHYYQIATD